MSTLAPLTSYEYMAGTCTLRLTGQLSVLSQVADRPVLKRSRFQLQLWDEAVVTAEPGGRSTDQPVLELSGRELQLSELTDVVQRYVQILLQNQTITSIQGVSQGISLAPVGLTRHRLVVAGVAAGERAQTLELSTLQLADLAEVLEQMDRAAERLPEDAVTQPQPQTRRRVPLWLGSVAAVAVAAVLGSQWLTTVPLTVTTAPTADTAPDGESFSREENLADENPEATASGPPLTEPEPPSTASNRPAPPAASPQSPAALPTVPPVTNSDGATSPPPRSPVPSPSSARPEPPATANAPETSGAISSDSALDGPSSSTAAEPAAGDAASSPTVAADQPRPEAITSARSSTAPNPAATTSSAAMTEAWLGQLKAVLEEQWQPPTGLRAPLRFGLTVEPDGTVGALVPLTELARVYQGQPGLPQVGSVIPNLLSPQPITVEVEFLPSGEVLITPNSRESAP